ncbi:hypothetical protein [Natranaerobius trueperi]|nr:hypothetical protein [Natranaerobius trueperi]
MLARKNVIAVCLLGTFLIGYVFHDYSVLLGLQTLFWSMLSAGSELLDLILLIALMTAMIKSLQAINADEKMIKPCTYLMITSSVSYWVLGIVMYILSLFFWPTPTTALVGTIIVPAAVKSGLTPMGAAVSMTILGHGMALSGDFIIQGAPGFSERAIGLEPGTIVFEAALLSIVTGSVASIIAFFMYKQEFCQDKTEVKKHKLVKKDSYKQSFKSTLLAIVVPCIFIGILILMIYYDIQGNEATALLGGTALIIIIIANSTVYGIGFLDHIANYLTEGFVFSIKVFSKVIPVTGFFFLGSSQTYNILGKEANEILFDIAIVFTEHVPLNSFIVVLGNLILGIISGLDGSGFSGIALTANFAEVISNTMDVSIAPLAAIGQMGAIWTGGGTLTSWAFGLVATAGVVGVDPIELARKNFIPVLVGLLSSSLVAVIIM